MWLSLIHNKTLKNNKMKTQSENVNQAIRNFALEYSYRNDVMQSVEMASDYLETVKEVDLFEMWLALFLAGKETVEVEKMNDDCTWRTEIVKVAA